MKGVRGNGNQTVNRIQVQGIHSHSTRCLRLSHLDINKVIAYGREGTWSSVNSRDWCCEECKCTPRRVFNKIPLDELDSTAQGGVHSRVRAQKLIAAVSLSPPAELIAIGLMQTPWATWSGDSICTSSTSQINHRADDRPSTWKEESRRTNRQPIFPFLRVGAESQGVHNHWPNCRVN